MQKYYNTCNDLTGGLPEREEGGPPDSVCKGDVGILSLDRLVTCRDLNEIDEVSNSYTEKCRQQQAYYEWLAGLKTWKYFISLTFREERTPDVAYSYYRRLVQVVNKRTFGKGYIRRVGHSYFNYVVGMEFKLAREVCHFHVLVDRPVEFHFIHNWWNMAAGWVWIDKINDREKAMYYVTKYVCKSGDENINFYLKAEGKIPKKVPLWWFES